MEGAARWSIHMCSWHDGQHLLEFLSSVDQQTDKNVQIVVIDHAETQCITERVRSGRSDLVVLKNAFDRGFVRSHEQAITFALARWSADVLDHRFVLMTHPDVLLEPHALARFEEAFIHDPSLVAVGPKILRAKIHVREDGERSVQFSDEIESVGLAMGKSRRLLARGAGEGDRGQYHEADRRAFPSSVCVAFRASFLHRQKERGVCFFDALPETLAITDLLWRAKLQGKGVCVLSDVVVWHHAHQRQTMDNKAKGAYKVIKGSDEDEVMSSLFLLEIMNGFIRFLFFHAGWLLVGAVRFAGWMAIRPSGLKKWFEAIGCLPRAFKRRFREKKHWKASAGAVKTWFV